MTGLSSVKQDLRAKMRRERRALCERARYQKSLALVEKMQQSNLITVTIQHIALYASFDGELNVLSLGTWLLAEGKTLYLPVLHPVLPALWFAPFSPHTPLHKNRYGITEPFVTPHQVMAPFELDLVVVPLVAFDQQGHRLGMGKGLYDRSFAFRYHQRISTPLLVGAAYDFQAVETLPIERHDLKLDGVVTV